MTDGHTSNCSQVISKSTLNELERFSFFLLYCIIVNKSKTISFIRIAKKRLFFGKCYMMGKWHESLAATSDLFPVEGCEKLTSFPYGEVLVLLTRCRISISFLPWGSTWLECIHLPLRHMFILNVFSYVYRKNQELLNTTEVSLQILHHEDVPSKFRKVSLLSLSL